MGKIPLRKGVSGPSSSNKAGNPSKRPSAPKSGSVTSRILVSSMGQRTIEARAPAQTAATRYGCVGSPAVGARSANKTGLRVS
mmetsp:Transcript_15904/g.33369  ORF Transcript_15904/g.33369 Transcript_15904/m.33369 type:complete len:83 (+) Transcript_15904:173-421(+)